MSNPVVNFFTKAAISAGRSLLLSEVKGAAKGFINSKRAKTADDIAKEMNQSLGYITSHYSVNKAQEIIYKSSPAFCLEFLTNSPLISEKIVRDEETGHLYVDGNLITNAKKLDILGRFMKATNIKSASLQSHMENGFKLIDPTDVNSIKFKDYFSGWDTNSKSAIDAWVPNVFGELLQTDEKYASMLFRKWIIGTAKRAIEPGVNFDGCLVLCGKGGTGKTSHFRNLLPEPFNNRTGEIYCNIKNAVKFVENIKGKTIACFDELSVLDYTKTEEIFKQLLSSQHVDVRLPWAREPRRYALRQGFCATSNKEQFIPDEFFSRRLWTIQLGAGRINFDYMFANQKQLWQEAVYFAQQGESCILSIEEQKLVEDHNKKFVVSK